MSFGASTDPWGYADTNTLLLSSGEEPQKSEAQCEDSNGDVSASTMYDSYTNKSATYRLVGGASFKASDTGNDFRLGKVISGAVITDVTPATSNAEFPEITISGRTTNTADSLMDHYDWSALVSGITGVQSAQAVGGSVDTNSKLTGWSGSATCNFSPQLDSQGAEKQSNVHAGRMEATLDFAGCSGAPGAAADTGWTVSTGPSDNEGNTAYGNGSLSVFQNLAQDT